MVPDFGLYPFHCPKSKKDASATKPLDMLFSQPGILF